MKKKKVIRLENSNNRITVIGISSHEKGYTLTWALNKHLGMSFIRSDDLEEERPGFDAPLRFPVFSYADETKRIDFYLIQNRTPEGFLIREWQAIDFILVIPEPLDPALRNDLIARLRKVPGIQTSFPLNPDEIPGSERLILE